MELGVTRRRYGVLTLPLSFFSLSSDGYQGEDGVLQHILPPWDDLSFAPSVYDRVRIGVLFSDGNLFSIFIARDLGCMASSYSPLEASSMRSSKLLSTVHARSLGGYIVLYVRLSFARERAKEIN